MPRILTRSVFFTTLVLLALVWLTPLAITSMVAVKDREEYATNDLFALPQRFALWENIQFAWTTGTLGSSFVNTMIYAAIGAGAAILFASLAAYALVHLKPRFSFGWFLLIYSGTIFPFQMYLLPLYYLYINTNLYDSQVGLTLFYIAICIPFCLFVLRNFFTTIPDELSEAARLDGLNDFGVYWRIYMPLSGSAIAALFLFQFTWVWNDLLFGITLARSEGVRPLMAGLAGMRGIYAAQNIPGVLSGALIASVPTILIFLALRRYLLQGLVLSTQGE
ncbi:MAG: carbohydrate ABC transporter permease [Anaerolineae bacterium]|nr:carbohydrate ABC transporter permease [Anaerolineae bacterium]